MTRFDTRLTRVEGRLAAVLGLQERDPPVHRLPWDAIDEEPGEHRGGIWLPEKAPSPEAWAQRMRQRWPEFGGGSPSGVSGTLPQPPVERRPRHLDMSPEQAQAFAKLPVHERLTAVRRMQTKQGG
jgi:hypothetical protein